MASEPMSKSKTISEERFLDALYEKDRLNYSGQFVQGFVHNANGPLMNISMLAEMVLAGVELQDKIVKNRSGEDKEWSALVEKQRRRLTQMREQISRLSGDLREFVQLYEMERLGTEIDINTLLTRMEKVFRADLFFKHYVNCEMRLAQNLPHLKVPGKCMAPAVFHLFQNGVAALKTSPQKLLSVETSMEDGQITVRITDSGNGLPEGVEPESLFDLFESRWPNTENKGGSSVLNLGFGLYAARQLLLPYGLEVSLEKSAQGTTALIRAPLDTKSA